ncbi:MAG: antibiotic biosynthesis monooxygenase [Gemmatimonadota bacterium]|nr:antibiotic biosynthesis monooxygenase [Gemmatimonadota bacterium]
MIYVLVRHQVQDYPHWKKVFDEAEEWRRDHGEKRFEIFQREHENTDLTLLFGWDEIGIARDFFASTELRRRMEEAGVVGEPEVTFLQLVDRGEA